MAQKLKEDLREKIENAALEVLDEKGINNCDMRSIAQKAGCTTGNLYRYYLSKDQLILSLTQPIMNRMSEIILEQTGGQVNLYSTVTEIPKANYQESPSDYVKRVVQPLVYNAMEKLGEEGRANSKRMRILLTATIVGDKMRQWASSLMKSAFMLCFATETATQAQADIMLNIVTNSFCESAMQLLVANNGLSESEYNYMLQSTMDFQFTAIAALIDREIKNKTITPNREVFGSEKQ